MKIPIMLALVCSTAALFGQADPEPEGRVQLSLEWARPTAITVAEATTPIQNQPGRMTGGGIRFLGEIATAPKWFYEIAGAVNGASKFTLNGPIGNNTTLDISQVKVSTTYWAVGGAYLAPITEQFTLGAHLEARGEMVKAEGPVFQNLNGTGLAPWGTVSGSTTYLRPWARVSADYSWHWGEWAPYVGVDAAAALMHTKQTTFVSLDLIDSRTLKALAPGSAITFYLGAKF